MIISYMENVFKLNKKKKYLAHVMYYPGNPYTGDGYGYGLSLTEEFGEDIDDRWGKDIYPLNSKGLIIARGDKKYILKEARNIINYMNKNKLNFKLYDEDKD